MQKLFSSVNFDRRFTPCSSQWQYAPRPRFDPFCSIKNELAKASRLNNLPHPPITLKALAREHSANANQPGLFSVLLSQWLDHLHGECVHIAGRTKFACKPSQFCFDHINFVVV